jgi:hypothetical protein
MYIRNHFFDDSTLIIATAIMTLSRPSTSLTQILELKDISSILAHTDLCDRDFFGRLILT